MCYRFKIYRTPAKQVAQVKNIKIVVKREERKLCILKYNSVKSIMNSRIALYIIFQSEILKNHRDLEFL